MRLRGRTALLTGAGKGIGPAIARKLAAEGADLAVLGRDKAAIEALAAEIKRLGRRCFPCKADVTSAVEIETAIDEALAFLNGRIDILVNVAGVSGPVDKPAWQLSEREFDDVMDVNLKGVFLIVRAVLPHMIERREGRIINIAGTHGHRGRALRSAYSASKWGLRGLTRSVALEAGPYNITVNSISPGPILGERLTKSVAESAAARGIAPAAVLAERTAETALRRLVEPEDVAEAVLFFSSDAARNITGQDLAVDAGALA
jgi:NAD(P)-dependent dehydrogenase (short-subunit alcohol dehydrogenase family)